MTTPTPKNELNKAIVDKLAVCGGDLGQLNKPEMAEYYGWFCRNCGLDPATVPFDILKAKDGKLRLYANRGTCAQLGRIYGVSHQIMSREIQGPVYIVTARASTPSGRQEESIGAVAIKDVFGEALSNAMMKAETKAKRRSTLDLLGLGMLDEEEISGTDLLTKPLVTPEEAQTAPKPTNTAPSPENKPTAIVEATAPLKELEVEPPATDKETVSGGDWDEPVAPDPNEQKLILIAEHLEQKGIPEAFVVKLLVAKKVSQKTEAKTISELEDEIIDRLLDEGFLSKVANAYAAAKKDAPKQATTAPSPYDQEGILRKPAPGNPYVDTDLAWKEVEVHFGKDKGLAVGKMNRAKFQFYYEQWHPAPYKGKISENDFKLDAALILAVKSGE